VALEGPHSQALQQPPGKGLDCLRRRASPASSVHRASAAAGGRGRAEQVFQGWNIPGQAKGGAVPTWVARDLICRHPEARARTDICWEALPAGQRRLRGSAIQRRPWFSKGRRSPAAPL